jgi:hypothetical protein
MRKKNRLRRLENQPDGINKKYINNAVILSLITVFLYGHLIE